MNETKKLPDFQKRLRLLRGNYTQGTFANMLGIARSTLASYESGERVPSAFDLVQIAKCCGVSADYLLGLTEVKDYDFSARNVCNLTGLSERTVKTLLHDKKQESNLSLFALAFTDVFLGEANSSKALLKTEHYLIQAAAVHYFQQEFISHGVLELNPEELRDLCIRSAAEPLQKLVMDCLLKCSAQIEEELDKEREGYVRDGKKPDGDFQGIAFRKMIEESNRKERLDG